MNNIDKPFNFFEVTADIGFNAFGNTLEESFENAGLAMFNIISNTNNINKSKSFHFEIESEDKIALLYDYLEELLFLHETEFVLLSDFNVIIKKEKDNYHLKASVKGETINWNIHYKGSEVKAITFHMMEVNETNSNFNVKAILDL